MVRMLEEWGERLTGLELRCGNDAERWESCGSVGICERENGRRYVMSTTTCTTTI